MYLSVLNIRSFSTDTGTVTITNSATLAHSPNLSRAPKRLASPQTFWQREGLGGGCADCGLLSDSPLLAAAGFASSCLRELLWAPGTLSTSQHFFPGNLGLF